MNLQDLQDSYVSISEMLWANRQDTSEGYEWNNYRNGRNSWGITCVASGQAVITYQDGTQHTLSAGEILIYPPRSAYTFYIPKGVESYVHYTINYAVNNVYFPWMEPTKAFSFFPENYLEFHRLCNDIAQIWEDKQIGFRIICTSKLYELIYDIIDYLVQQKMRHEDVERVLPARLYMMEHYQESIHLEDLAKMCNLSLTHFRRLFRVTVGTSPISFLITLRIDRAKDLLQTNELSIGQIAEMTGFQSANYFSRYFREMTGQTPNQYRKQL